MNFTQEEDIKTELLCIDHDIEWHKNNLEELSKLENELKIMLESCTVNELREKIKELLNKVHENRVRINKNKGINRMSDHERN